VFGVKPHPKVREDALEESAEPVDDCTDLPEIEVVDAWQNGLATPRDRVAEGLRRRIELIEMEQAVADCRVGLTVIRELPQQRFCDLQSASSLCVFGGLLASSSSSRAFRMISFSPSSMWWRYAKTIG
jgi:hypothetical protein